MNKCSIENCSNPLKYGSKLYCGKHYERVRVHGNVNADFRSGKKVKFRLCKIVNCQNDATHSKGTLCKIHYLRHYRHSSFESKIPNYGSNKRIHEDGYIMIWTGKKYRMEHIILAEKALGKPLPLKAVVHHMNKDKTDNHRFFNLVICPDQAYHLLLHRRMRKLELKGVCSE